MSREIETRIQVERNRLSILLAFLRRQLTSAEYQGLLRMQGLTDHWLRTQPVSLSGRKAWILQVQLELDGVFGDLESGQFSRRRLQRLIHLYRDLFLLK